MIPAIANALTPLLPDVGGKRARALAPLTRPSLRVWLQDDQGRMGPFKFTYKELEKQVRSSAAAVDALHSCA